MFDSKQAVDKILSGVPVKEAVSYNFTDSETGQSITGEVDPWKTKDIEKQVKQVIDAVTDLPEYEGSYYGKVDKIAETIKLLFTSADDTGFYANKISDRFEGMVKKIRAKLKALDLVTGDYTFNFGFEGDNPCIYVYFDRK